jgi:Rrf2 family protein
MRLSRKSDYALRALFALAAHVGKGPLSIRTIATKNDVPKKFLEQIMLELKAQGWVRSIPGRIGGFEMAIPPDVLSMGQVVRYFDGILAPIGCVSSSDYEPCSQEPFCRFRRVLLDIRNFTTQLMDKATIASVLRGEPVRKDEVFSAGDGI